MGFPFNIIGTVGKAIFGGGKTTTAPPPPPPPPKAHI